MKLLELRSTARRLRAQNKVEIIFIDYIGLIQNENSNLPRHEQIGEVSRSLKSLARELKIPIVVLSQVGRQPEGNRPTPSSMERKPMNPFVERQIFKLSRMRVNKDIFLL